MLDDPQRDRLYDVAAEANGRARAAFREFLVPGTPAYAHYHVCLDAATAANAAYAQHLRDQVLPPPG